MNRTELELLQKAITNFKCKEYDESQFHSTFETVIGMITESHNYEIRRMFEPVLVQICNPRHTNMGFAIPIVIGIKSSLLQEALQEIFYD